MPHKDGDGQDVDERPSERRQRLKSERDPNRPQKTRSSRPKVIDEETGELVRPPHRRRKEKESKSEPTANISDIVPELSRTSSTPGASSRSSLPYPTFSKAHSKEAVNVRDDISTTTAPSLEPSSKRNQYASRNSPYTPESNSAGSDKQKQRSKDSLRAEAARSKESLKAEAAAQSKESSPPSPPEPESLEQKKLPSRTPSRTSQLKEEAGTRPRSTSSSSQKSWFGRLKAEMTDGSKISSRSKEPKANLSQVKNKYKPADNVEDGSELSAPDSEFDSNATSVAPPRTKSAGPRVIPPGLDADDSPESNHEPSPRTPTATPQFVSHEFSKPTPSPAPYSYTPGFQSGIYDSPMPPPPPPPPDVPVNLPRVDYLLQNGGLPRPAPRTLMAVTPAYASQPHPSMNTPAPPEIERVFGPFYNLLDQYDTVFAKNGSIAVATGYRSVARRLLDRLENIFNRELSSSGCSCVMCRENDNHGLKAPGWGDILEATSGRMEIPSWPALDFASIRSQGGQGLGIHGTPPRPGSPVKIDPDIAEEFHQQYLRQTKKTKASVDKWLNSTPGAVASPPPDVDDETLSFTILTHLDPADRTIFNALVAGSAKPVESMSRAPTPSGKPRADIVVRAGLALKRLYRLQTEPRDPETCVYLLKNPDFHNLLVSLSEVNSAEWEILISGRFDGFLWSGADAEFPGMSSPSFSRLPTPAQAPTRGPTPGGAPSRGPTPAGRHPDFSRTTTPLFRGSTSTSPYGLGSMPPTPLGQNRSAVSNDEETEIAALAELEREIYLGMEALEDAFEGLHRKAEVVRRALRERGAGLSLMAQTRRGGGGEGIYASLNTPGVGERGWEGYGGFDGQSDVDIESEWGGDDGGGELVPDDSASNISSSRHRRPKRRVERRTPAPVEEEDETTGSFVSRK